MSYMKTGTLPFACGVVAVVNCSYSLQTGQWQRLPIALPALRAVYSNMGANSARTVVKPVKVNRSSNPIKARPMVPDVFVAYARKYDSDKVQATIVHLTAVSLHPIMDVI